MSVITSSTDSDLIQRVSGNDSKALEALYNRYSPLLYTLIKKIVVDEETAREVLSDVFVIIWRKIDFFDFYSTVKQIQDLPSKFFHLLPCNQISLA